MIDDTPHSPAASSRWLSPNCYDMTAPAKPATPKLVAQAEEPILSSQMSPHPSRGPMRRLADGLKRRLKLS